MKEKFQICLTILHSPVEYSKWQGFKLERQNRFCFNEKRWATYVRKCVANTFKSRPMWSHWCVSVWKNAFLLFFKKMANPSLFFIYFRSFQTNFTIFTTNKCEKCPSSIRHRESNTRPLDRECLPITTRPGLPPKAFSFVRHILIHLHLEKIDSCFSHSLGNYWSFIFRIAKVIT